MGDAQQIDQRQILLHRQAGLGGQVLGRHEVACCTAVGVPLRAARGVENRLVEALAGLGRHAIVAARARQFEGVQSAVGFIDDHRQAQRAAGEIDLESRRALDRLLDEQDRSDEALQPGGAAHACEKLGHRRCMLVLLVAVKRGEVRGGAVVEHRGNCRQARDVRCKIAAHLEFEIAMPVGSHHFLEGFGQTVADTFVQVRGGDRVDHADGMARFDR